MTATMKAMVLTKPGHIELQILPRPLPSDDEVLVKVGHSGICGTDLKIYNGRMPAKYPIIMGHEIAGTIVEGKAPGGIKPGTRVIVDPTVFCGTCFHCKIGQTNLCPKGEMLGRERNGGFAEYVTAPKQNVFALPDEISDEEAAFTQVFSTCVHAQRMAPIAPEESVIIIGLGVSGQLHAQLAKAAGAKPIIGITRSAWKRELAQDFGLDLTLEQGKDIKAQVLEATNGLGADLVIETSGKVECLSQAMELVRIGGRILPFGIYTDTEGKLPFYYLYYKEIQILSARASKGEAFPASVDLVHQGTVKLEPLITHVLPMNQLDEGLALQTATSEKRMKVIMKND